MKRFKWSIILGMSLISFSILLYGINYLIFGDFEGIFARAMGSLAFVPIQGLVVTLIIAELLVVMGKRSRLQKMRMVVGVFFSELGTNLLMRFCASDAESGAMCDVVESVSNWSTQNVPTLLEDLETNKFDAGMDRNQLEGLGEFLVTERNFLARLLENPNLLEDERFTEMLWAVFHLTEELDARSGMSSVPDSDLEHLNVDVTRAYSLLFREWLYYMKHLHGSYPFLFSFAMRINPLDPNRQVEVV